MREPLPRALGHQPTRSGLRPVSYSHATGMCYADILTIPRALRPRGARRPAARCSSALAMCTAVLRSQVIDCIAFLRSRVLEKREHRKREFLVLIFVLCRLQAQPKTNDHIHLGPHGAPRPVRPHPRGAAPSRCPRGLAPSGPRGLTPSGPRALETSGCRALAVPSGTRCALTPCALGASRHRAVPWRPCFIVHHQQKKNTPSCYMHFIQ